MRTTAGILVLALTAGSAVAEMNRPHFARENAYPELLRPEVGLDVRYSEVEERDEFGLEREVEQTEYALFTRLRVAEPLTLHARLPYRSVEPDGGDTESGIGDITVGADLLAYADIFDYPYVIPHVEVTFDTGDEDKGLGEGDSRLRLGVSVGTVVEDVVHFIADASYNVYDERDNEAEFGGVVMWDVDERFSVLAEANAREDGEDEDGDYVTTVLGGMVYRPVEGWAVGVHGGAELRDSEEDLVMRLKMAYQF